MPSLVAFDLDGTLAPSKGQISPEVMDALLRLLDHVPVSVISGGQWTQFEKQLLSQLPDVDGLAQLHLMPTCGTRYLRWENHGWTEIYSEPLSEEDRIHTIQCVREQAQQLGLWETDTWGEVIEDRETQITFSALGQHAPLEAKEVWDPEGEKRAALAAALAPLLPHLEVRVGGSTSVDITSKGIDKAHGMRELSDFTGIDLADMVFVGDRLDPDGNDFPVIALGVEAIPTSGPEETLGIIEDLIVRIAAPNPHSDLA